MSDRVYLDWNASAPLRPEAREAMLAAMDVVGNPSSVHAEGRSAKAIVEKARIEVALLVGSDPDDVVFTSGATEAMAIVDGYALLVGSEIEHDSVHDHLHDRRLKTDGSGIVSIAREGAEEIALQVANSETGVLNSRGDEFVYLRDATQAVGKIDWRFDRDRMVFAILSSHKIGGPKGVGAVLQHGANPMAKGGGQEKGYRSGTENVFGIAGFGAAAKAARRDLEAGVWERVEELRNRMEDRLASTAPDLIIFGQDAPRLPNTSCFAVPGWKGETQVMQMDLAGYAISAGSACSSGKVNKASRVLLAMGFDEETASSAIRVSIGPTTTEADVMGFADAWTEHYHRRKARAA